MKTQYIEGNDFVDDVLTNSSISVNNKHIYKHKHIIFGGSLDVSVRLKVVFNTKKYFFHLFYVYILLYL